MSSDITFTTARTKPLSKVLASDIPRGLSAEDVDIWEKAGGELPSDYGCCQAARDDKECEDSCPMHPDNV